MHFLLDRFPIEILREFVNEIETKNHIVKMAITTVQSSHLLKDEENFLLDRSISRGKYFNTVPWVINQNIIEEFSKHESIIQPLFSRFSINQSNFTATEISTHYYLLVNFWIFHLKNKKIDACFHYYAPHDPSSIVLHICCKYLKIPNLFIDVAHVFMKYRYLAGSFNDRSRFLINDVKKPILVNDLLNKLRFNIKKNNYDALPKFIVNRNQNSGIRNSLKRKKIFIEKNFNRKYLFCKLRNFKNLFKNYPTLFKKSRYFWNSNKSEFTRIEYEIFVLILKIKLFFKKRKYNSICSKVPSKKFIYFAAPAQPEGTTLPSALYYSNLLLAIKTLRDGLKEDIDIVFKENLSNFETHNPYISGVAFKSPDFYNQLQEIKGIKFVNCTYPSIKLIEKSIATATINGTAAIEAVALNKKAFIFSSNWYESIPGIYRVVDSEIIKQNINNLENIDYSEFAKELSFDYEMMIEFNKYNSYLIEDIESSDLVEKFLKGLSKYEKFKNEDRKWLI